MNTDDLKLSSYHYDLPKQLIADRPIAGRDGSRMLVYQQSSGEIIHDYFKNIAKYLPKDSTIVMNESKVFPCRLNGQKTSGGKVEVFFLDAYPNESGLYRVMIRSNGKKRIGDELFFPQDLILKIEDKSHTTFFVSANKDSLIDYLNTHASIPIPPYIRDGMADEKDESDYQTVFAKNVGSVAAPTAGLHFTDKVLSQLKNERQIELAKVTLHVGMGTFAPVKSENILDHDMHTEHYCIEDEAYQRIIDSNFITAVGTTSLRTLESAHRLQSDFRPGIMHDTDIFLYPGIEVRSINALLTNFHLPQSTLLMLVSSLVGRETTLKLYEEAIKNEYRFFSYGDCMLIIR